jgi:phosphatidate cytidylyltransferase
MARRVAVGFALGGLGIACAQSPISFALLVFAVAVTSLWELTRLVERKDAGIESPIAFTAVVVYLVLTYAGTIKRYESELLATTLLCALGFAAFSGKGNAVARSGATLLSVLYIGKLTSYFIAIRAIPEIGLPLTIFVMTAVALTDTFAMAIGKWIGRTPLSRLSPKKTVEGAVAGFAAACLTGVAFSFVAALGLTWWEGLFVGAVTSLAAQAGDLVESAIKRDARVKDAGSAILGHGGVLDRFDSFLFGGIAFYFALWIVGFGVPHLHMLMHAGRLE